MSTEKGRQRATLIKVRRINKCYMVGNGRLIQLKVLVKTFITKAIHSHILVL